MMLLSLGAMLCPRPSGRHPQTPQLRLGSGHPHCSSMAFCELQVAQWVCHRRPNHTWSDSRLRSLSSKPAFDTNWRRVRQTGEYAVMFMVHVQEGMQPCRPSPCRRQHMPDGRRQMTDNRRLTTHWRACKSRTEGLFILGSQRQGNVNPPVHVAASRVGV